jgi:hypothetical protein
VSKSGHSLLDATTDKNKKWIDAKKKFRDFIEADN